MFRVIWTAGALNDLADAWRHADAGQRQAVTLASNVIDEKLRTDPLGSSESRDDEDRVLFEEPLGVLFVVDRSKRIVRVDHVWYYQRREK